MAQDDGWTVLGAHPAEDCLAARSPAGQRVRLRRGNPRQEVRWIGPLAIGDGGWWVAAEDGRVVVDDLEVDAPEAVRAVIAHARDDAGLALEAPIHVFPDGRCRTPDGVLLAVDDPATTWVSKHAARLASDPIGPSALQGQVLRAAAAGDGPDRPAIARVALLMVALGFGAGWWLAPRAPLMTVRVDGADDVVITCPDARITGPGPLWTVPFGSGRCTVEAHVGSVALSAPLDRVQGRTYRCRAEEQGLRCEQG